MEREEVRFAVEGDEIAAGLFRPQAAGRFPCVVLGTGLADVRDQHLDDFAERFAAAGFCALSFDYRHFGESGGEPRCLMTPGGQRRDWRAAIAHARSLDCVDERRIALWGFSLGGGHAQAVALSEPSIDAVVAVAPAIDGLRSLLYVGGPSHVARLAAAGLRDLARGLRGAEPYRVPAGGPPGTLAVLNSPGALRGYEAATPPGSSWRNEICARAALAPPYRLQRKTQGIRCPILYCLTEDDDVNPPELGRQAAGRAPGESSASTRAATSTASSVRPSRRWPATRSSSSNGTCPRWAALRAE